MARTYSVGVGSNEIADRRGVVRDDLATGRKRYEVIKDLMVGISSDGLTNRGAELGRVRGCQADHRLAVDTMPVSNMYTNRGVWIHAVSVLRPRAGARLACGFVGSQGRLGALVQMGALASYPSDPYTKFLGTNSTLDVLGQEAGHRWMSFVRVAQNGTASDEILGRDLAHWSFFMDSDASDMEGNDIMDLGSGRFFETVGATSRFSALDQYLMGLIPPEQVGPMFFVRNASSDTTRVNPSSNPRIGVEFGGDRVDFTVDDIIAVEGERRPSAQDSNKTFNMAFVLLAPPDRPARAESIAKLQGIAREWVKYFSQATDGHGRVSTKINKR